MECPPLKQDPVAPLEGSVSLDDSIIEVIERLDPLDQNV